MPDIAPAVKNQAVDLSMNKYCSVTKMLEKTVEIEASYEIIEA